MRRNLILLFITVFASIVLFDVLLRHPSVSLRFFATPAAYYINRFHKIHKIMRHSPNIDIKAKVAGDLAWISGTGKKNETIRYVTDSSGYRNTLSSQTNTFDTIILGDSFGVAGLTDHKDLLSEQLNSKGYKSYNISTNMIGMWEEMIAMKYELHSNVKMHGNKRIIWLLFEGNDMEGKFLHQDDPLQMVNSVSKEFSVRLENYYKRSIIKFMIKRLYSKSKKQVSHVIQKPFFSQTMMFYDHYIESLAWTYDQITNHNNADNITQTMQAMAAYAELHDLSLYCVVIPVKARVYQWAVHGSKPWTSDTTPAPFARFIETLCESEKIVFMDLSPKFIEESKRIYEQSASTLYWLDDTHWNDVGQRTAAQIIDEMIKKNEPEQLN